MTGFGYIRNGSISKLSFSSYISVYMWIYGEDSFVLYLGENEASILWEPLIQLGSSFLSAFCSLRRRLLLVRLLGNCGTVEKARNGQKQRLSESRDEDTKARPTLVHFFFATIIPGRNWNIASA